MVPPHFQQFLYRGFPKFEVPSWGSPIKWIIVDIGVPILRGSSMQILPFCAERKDSL